MRKKLVFADILVPLVLLLASSRAALPDASPRGTDPVVEVLSMIERSVADPRIGWVGEWQREYVDTIRQALGEDHSRPDCAARIEILRRGFPQYWSKCKLSGLTQAEYEMRKAEIRWYCETLVAEEPASVSEKALLKAQFADLCDYAAEYLVARFPFLTPERVQEGKRAALREYEDELQVPLIPIFRRPFSKDQLQAIKANWGRLYMRWFFTWRYVRYGAEDPDGPSGPTDVPNHPHYRFVKRCLSYLPRTIWPTLGKPPEYVLDAITKLNAERAERVRVNRQAGESERNLAMRFSNQVEQVEQWSFILTALLETGILDENRGPSSANLQKGGDAYELRKQP